MENSLKQAIDRMKNGEEKGFNEVYSQTFNRVYFRAKQIMKKEEDAQDLTQIVFVEAYKCIGSLQAPEALYGWLDGITYRQGMKIFRKNKDILLTEEAEGLFDTLENNDLSTIPELSADQKATSEIIKGIIEELPELQKTAIVMFYFDGMKVEQIASVMECSENTIKSRLNYARKFIKNKVEEKEKKEGYRLHTIIALPVLWHAIKAISDKTTLTAHAAQGAYNGACATVGVQATAITVGAGATTGVGASAVGTGGAGATTTGASTVATLSAGAKALIIAGAVTVIGGLGGLVYFTMNNQIDTPQVESQIEETDQDSQTGLELETSQEVTQAINQIEEQEELNISPREFEVFGIYVTQDGEFEFEFRRNDEIHITKYLGSKENLIVPKEIEGYPVTSMGYQPFDGNSFIETVIVEAEVESGVFFTNCPHLKKVEFPVTVRHLGYNALYNTPELEEITVSKACSVSWDVAGYDVQPKINYYEYIPEFPVGEKVEYNLTWVTKDGLFQFYIDGLERCCITKYFGTDTTVTLPSEIHGYHVDTIDLSGDKKIEKLILEEGIENMGDVSECSALKELVLPKSLMHIGYRALEGTQITEVTVSRNCNVDNAATGYDVTLNVSYYD